NAASMVIRRHQCGNGAKIVIPKRIVQCGAPKILRALYSGLIRKRMGCFPMVVTLPTWMPKGMLTNWVARQSMLHCASPEASVQSTRSPWRSTRVQVNRLGSGSAVANRGTEQIGVAPSHEGNHRLKEERVTRRRQPIEGRLVLVLEVKGHQRSGRICRLLRQ